MITVTRDGSDVVVGVTTNLPHESGSRTDFLFQHNCGDGETQYAELLTRHIRHVLDTAVETTRREHYEAGRKDAKAKRRKRTWFGSALVTAE